VYELTFTPVGTIAKPLEMFEVDVKLVFVITPTDALYPLVKTELEPICTMIDEVLFVETPLNSTVIRFTQLGILVKSIEVPDVEATAVPAVMALLIPLTTTEPVPAGNVTVLVPATAGTANVTLPEVEPLKDGVVNAGLVFSTFEPEPVDVVAPVPPFATGKAPVA
jgi:hypothetical protein